MSDQEESNVNSQEQQQDEQQNDSEQQEEEDDQEQQQDDQEDEDDQDEQQNSNEEDQDDGEQDEEQENQDESENQKKLPTFNMIKRQPPEQFKFTSLLSQISNLSTSVDNFIDTLHSTPSSGFNRRPYTTNYSAQEPTYQMRQEQIKTEIPHQSRVVMMKDEDTQVDMKPQIIIQPTKTVKQDPIIQAKPYRISNESEKFLANLYEQNKKLKRWQTNPNHAMSSYMASYTGSNGFGNPSKGFYGSRDKFERKQYEKGIFNVEQRNKQIDDAILMLKKQDEQSY